MMSHNTNVDSTHNSSQPELLEVNVKEESQSTSVTSINNRLYYWEEASQ